MKNKKAPIHFLKANKKKLIKEIGQQKLLSAMKSMLMIRHFETRAEAAYQQGYIGGFFHAYIGQEAIQTACVTLMGQNPWYVTTYRCHALALLLGVTPNEAMAELYGKSTGNAKGRGGSMHLFSDRMLGGFGIVGGHLPLAIGAAFSIKYLKQQSVAICFLGDGAVAQGAVHESLNLAALWNLPCLFVIENNKWGMGTAVERAIAVSPIAENLSKAYGISGYSVNGMDFFDCYGSFQKAIEEIKITKKPVILEAFTHRFKGHSVSDPGLYRTKEELKKVMLDDPIESFYKDLKKVKFINEKSFEQMNQIERERAVAAMEFAATSKDPDVGELEENVFCVS